ncbi:hypothetical protein BWI17_03965 [Betaproteobacteria bacterium GR16-43]|nr:hypothetical protein BWI17_03965 [Betaproteobacteria bacterium GR16-43]
MDEIAGRVAQSISDALEATFEPLSTEPVAGGCIHKAFKLQGEDGGGKRAYFVKANAGEHAEMFEAEANGLRAIANAAAIRVPKVVVLGSRARGNDGGENDSRDEDEHAWLVLEWLDLAPLDMDAPIDPKPGAKVTPAARLGEALAAQHRAPQKKFGWGRHNFIGSSPQPNVWSDDWLSFWRTHRLQAQLRLAAHKRLPSKMIDRGERLLADAEILFRTYSPAKSLLHGDLWTGKAAALADGTPVVFDPAVYVGDREADLAMTELFGGFPKDFQAGYRAAWALDDGYSVRRNFYNIYHLLNHANLFGGDYVRESEKLIERVLAEL